MRMLGKRFLSLLLTLGMLLMLLPAAAASELTMLQVDFLAFMRYNVILWPFSLYLFDRSAQ